MEKKYFTLCIGDKNFYHFLLRIGLTPKKSLTILKLDVPSQFFPDFLRGCIDGDGSITVTSHPESQHKQLRIRLVSASLKFLCWIQEEIDSQFNTKGGWILQKEGRSVKTLSYGKADSIKILHKMYHVDGLLKLERKFDIARLYMGK